MPYFVRQDRKRVKNHFYTLLLQTDKLSESLKVQMAGVDGQWFNSFMILLLLRLLLLSYHRLLSSEEVQRNPSRPIVNSADYLSVCSFWKHIGKNRDMNHDSLLILLNLVFRNFLMLCNTYLQVTISPICAFLWVWNSYRIFAPGNKKEYININ